jgi:hypothetical protein
MQSDFKPVHLKNANAKLDKLLVARSIPMQPQEEDSDKEIVLPLSLWKKLLRLFRL